MSCVTLTTTLGLTPLILSNFWTKVVSLRLNKDFFSCAFSRARASFCVLNLNTRLEHSPFHKPPLKKFAELMILPCGRMGLNGNAPKAKNSNRLLF
jgi:hypothetical protein